MVDKPGFLMRSLLGRLLKSVDFARRIIDSLRDAEERGTVVYVMKTRSLIDYLFFNLAFLQHGLRLVRFANGVRTRMARGLFKGLAAVVRGRRGLPDDVDCMQALVGAGEPTTLFLREPRGREADQIAYALPYLERLVHMQRRSRRSIWLVPKLLIWEKRPDRARPTVFDDVFGSRQSPTFIKKLIYVIQNFWQSFLNLGHPTVQLTSAVNLKDFVAERTELSDIKIAQELRAQLADALQREEKVVVGPWVKSAAKMRSEILADQRVQNRLRERGLNFNDFKTSKRAKEIIDEIAADFSPLAIKAFSALLHPIWNTMYDGMEVDLEGLSRVRETARDKRLVIVPSHKSHIDYLALSYIFYNHGLIPPHIAAGVNLSFWPLGPIFRRAGAFFLRRSFAGDDLYAVLFSAYLIKLLEEGFFIEFFIEGTRSRTGKLAPPKYGMLNMIVEAFREGNVDQLAFIPVSVGYEKIIEGDSYRKELEGSEKKSESLGGLLKTPQVLRSRYGRVYVEFGEPVDLGQFIDAYHADRDAIPKEELERTVRRLAYRIIHEINDVTTVTPSALAALIILNATTRAIDVERLVTEAGFVIGYLRERGVRMSRTINDAINARSAALLANVLPEPGPESFNEFDRAYLEQDGHLDAEHASDDAQTTLGHAIRASIVESLQLLKDNKLIEEEVVEDEYYYAVRDDRRVELAFYKNNIVHYFADDAVFAVATAAAANDEGLADIDTARDYARFLSRMLKYEFCFNERREFESVFQNALQNAEEEGWVRDLQDEGRDEIELPAKRPGGFEFIRGLLVPLLESYLLAARSVSEQDAWIDPKALAKRAVALGRGAHMRGELHYAESRAQSTIETAVKIYREWGLLETRQRERGRKSVREVRLSPDWKGERLGELIADLERLAMPQQRQPADPLTGKSTRKLLAAVAETGTEAGDVQVAGT